MSLESGLGSLCSMSTASPTATAAAIHRFKRCTRYADRWATRAGAYQKGEVDPNETRHRLIKPGVDRAAKLYGGDDNIAPVVERFLLLERGNGLRWVELADVKPFEV